MRRPASRLIVLSPENHVLLFRFCHKDDALKGKTYWATPGGGLEHNESFELAALRELFEETGVTRRTTGPQIALRTFPMMLPSGENVHGQDISETIFQIPNHERCFGRLKEYRRIATRYDKTARNYLAMVKLGCIRLFYKRLCN